MCVSRWGRWVHSVTITTYMPQIPFYSIIIIISAQLVYYCKDLPPISLSLNLCMYYYYFPRYGPTGTCACIFAYIGISCMMVFPFYVFLTSDIVYCSLRKHGIADASHLCRPVSFVALYGITMVAACVSLNSLSIYMFTV